MILKRIKVGSCFKYLVLTLNAPIATKVVRFSRLLKCLRSLYGKQCGAVCSGFTLFASIFNSSVMLGNYLQQTTSADDIFRCNIFLGALRVKKEIFPRKRYLYLNPFMTNVIFHKATGNKVRMVHCIY